ncbi:MAG: hypothetical protein A2787_02295 [Omnitrophica WOR_2 bacterium RIFCSPHIGHO2_01_FULL_48_9]|nr:MAG: hypothetical protein A3D10_02090 [Omnitrophica WOR_2 bacterium RIFCSPHIGHO2_02_FULL_48_11]OGX30098.1 MAG: hypothetical protein A2787_02295 [Omnitrophica WOR_2 bacterium RIFCSPHIGHO2_01_FULL_48_9]
MFREDLRGFFARGWGNKKTKTLRKSSEGFDHIVRLEKTTFFWLISSCVLFFSFSLPCCFSFLDKKFLISYVFIIT